MAIDATFTVNGSAVTGAVAVAASSTVTLAIASTSGINLVSWSVVGTDRAAHAATTITSTGTPQGASASFSMPADAADGLGQSYLVQAIATDGGSPAQTSTFRAVIGVVNANGFIPIAAGEQEERSATHGWIELLNTAAGSTVLAGIANGWHPQVRMATAASLAAYTRVGDVITANANGVLSSIDSVSPPVVGDRLLLKNGAAGADNGIYVITSIGSAGTPFVLTRAYDMATGTTPKCMAIGAIEVGSANGGKQWKLTTVNPITLNSTSLSFTVF